jgi:hypothetical protein
MQVAELHESLLEAVGHAASVNDDGAPTSIEHEARTIAALTIFMEAWTELSELGEYGQRIVEKAAFEADPDWAIIAHFNAVAKAEDQTRTSLTDSDSDSPTLPHSLDILGLKTRWESIGSKQPNATPSEEYVEVGGAPSSSNVEDLATLKLEIQDCGAILRLFDGLVAHLAGLTAASERNALQVALHTLVGITELTLHRTTALDEARTYWLSQEASYHASAQWCGERADDIRWVLG